MPQDSEGNPIILPPGFDPDSSDWTQGGDYPAELDDIADLYGWDTWADILPGTGSYDASDVRPGAYMTPQEAIYRLHAQGIAAFAELVYFPEEQVWRVAVGDSE